MKTNVRILVILLVGLSTMGSCKRKELIETRYTRLLNTWQLNQLATDDNGNGKIDATEPHTLAAGYASEITFKNDSTGTETITVNNNPETYPFYWRLTDGDTVTRFGVGHNNISYHIDDISSATLRLSTVTDQGPVVYYYKRK